MSTARAPDSASDEAWMARALALAAHAEALGEVPVGAVVVADGVLLGAGWNQSIAARDPTAHAEIVALRAAAHRRDNHRLPGTTLYVTLEPCPMCAGAIVQARVARVVFGARDPRAGAAGSVFQLLDHAALNHRAVVSAGVAEAACARILSAFFRARRGGGPGA
jgi:tRNA(adenine34) deaminase